MKFTKKGFTLIELLVVIAIIGLLSTLAVVALNSARQRSRDAKRVADIRQIQTALELGFSETQRYPADGGQALGLGSHAASGTSQTASVLCNNATVPTFQGNTTGCSTIFMGLVPENPTPGGTSYYYNAIGTGDYFLSFSLEGQTGQLQSGANCANPDGIVAGASC